MAAESTSELLSDQVNKATRTSHTQLNRLITSRLPLCLPPYCSTPTVYAIGFAHFAYIYLSFEAVWEQVLTTYTPSNGSSVSKYDQPSRYPVNESVPTEQIPSSGCEEEHQQSLLALLASIRPLGLSRSERIRQDMSTLLNVPSEKVSSHLQSILSSSPALDSFLDHIRQAAIEKPHVLLAYAWVMYMAIFSGGRYIRAQLLRAGQGFWLPTKSSTPGDDQEHIGLAALPLEFWCHPGDHDGEDIKLAFKARLVEAETLLSAEQRKDVVDEAGYIFDLCLKLVQELEASVPVAFTGPDSHISKTDESIDVPVMDIGVSFRPSPLVGHQLRKMDWSLSLWTTTAVTLGTEFLTWLAGD